MTVHSKHNTNDFWPLQKPQIFKLAVIQKQIAVFVPQQLKGLGM